MRVLMGRHRVVSFIPLLLAAAGCAPGAQRSSDPLTNMSFNVLPISDGDLKNPWLKTVGDINGDGLVDLVAAGNSSGGLVWFENPHWTPHMISGEPGFGTDGEVADVDGDGDVDVLALRTSQLEWYENPSWASHLIDRRVLHDLEVADLDGDGDPDLVARNQGEFGHQGHQLHFYRQNSPTDWTHRPLTIPDGEGLRVTDLDRDGDADVVVNGRWYENRGDIVNGTWAEFVYTVDWTHPNSFVDAGDVNGDGRVDIALAPSELAGGTYRLSWFQAPRDPRSGTWIEHVVDGSVETVLHFLGIADLDSDGDMDLATAEMAQGRDPDEVKVYLNEDAAGLSWAEVVVGTSGSHSMRILDFDNDGDEDLFGANWQGQKLELFENLTCAVVWANWRRHVVDASRPWRAISLMSGDIDGDDLPDIVTGGWWYRNPGKPAGGWTRSDIGAPLKNAALVHDFDGDGHLDILGTRGEGSTRNPEFVWAHNDGSGSFTVISNVEPGRGDFLQGADVGRLSPGENLTVALSWHEANQGIQVLSLPADPLRQTWTWGRVSAVSQDEALDFGDIDRDNDLDLLLGTIWLENDTGIWREHTLFKPAGRYGAAHPDRNALADISRDGRLDAVVGYEAISVPGKLAWYEQGLQATSLWTEHVIATVVGPMSLDVADMDGDGDLDAVVGEHDLADPGAAKLSVFENFDGGGHKWVEHVVSVGDEHHCGARVVDIDEDGDLDIISIGWGHDDVLLYENTRPICAPHQSGGTR